MLDGDKTLPEAAAPSRDDALSRIVALVVFWPQRWRGVVGVVAGGTGVLNEVATLAALLFACLGFGQTLHLLRTSSPAAEWDAVRDIFREGTPAPRC